MNKVNKMKKKMIFASLFAIASIGAIVSIMLIGCNRERVSKNDISSLKSEALPTQKIEVDSLLGIDELVGVKDGNLICKGSNSANFFYVLDPLRHSVKTKFGVKGNARNEWIAPHLLLSDQKNICYVLDNGTKRIYKLNNYSIESDSKFPIAGVANNPKLYADYFCYSDEHPNEIVFRLNNFKDNTPVDSVVKEDAKKEGKAFLNSFSYDLYERNVVLAYQYLDQFEIYQITSKNKLELVCTVQGEGKVDENKNMYFSDVAIAGDKIYLLSQRNVNIAKEDGYSSIEVYDLEGKALRNYKLNFIAAQMRLDAASKTLYLLSAMDGAVEKVKKIFGSYDK